MMKKISLRDGELTFDAALVEAEQPTHLVLFAAGRGGDPERHLPLINLLSESGCTVVAPYFERLVSQIPTSEELLNRGRKLQSALHFLSQTRLPITGVGHSIGATLLMALAGAQMWMLDGSCLSIQADHCFDRLVLMAPPTGFFQAPNALDAVRIPIQVWAGTNDPITPVAQAKYLMSTLGERVPLDLRIVDGAGHFSFMNTLPPQVTDELADRELFLNRLAVDISYFVTA